MRTSLSQRLPLVKSLVMQFKIETSPLLQMAVQNLHASLLLLLYALLIAVATGAEFNSYATECQPAQDAVNGPVCSNSSAPAGVCCNFLEDEDSVARGCLTLTGVPGAESLGSSCNTTGSKDAFCCLRMSVGGVTKGDPTAYCPGNQSGYCCKETREVNNLNYGLDCASVWYPRDFQAINCSEPKSIYVCG